MNKKEIKEYFREHFPNNKYLRRIITRYRLEKFREPMLNAEQIALCEQNDPEKEKIVFQRVKQYPKFVRHTRKSVQHLFDNAPEYVNRADKKRVETDMLFCRFAYGFQPDEYLCFGLENKTAEERKTFVSDIDRMCYVYRMNDLFAIPIFNNKAKTYSLFKEYFKRDAVAIHKPEDFQKFENYVSQHPVFVKKAVYESMGRSVELIDINSCGKSRRELFDELIGEGLHLLEERVYQSEALSALNHSSVNTIRCITVRTKNGIEIPYCFMKVGRNGSFVDNGGAGGILVGIDKQTGKLNTNGYDELNYCYEKHPDSGVVFQGYQLPEWEKMLAICTEMSSKMNKVKYIGWDMSHTDEGWVVIEGNGMSQMIGPQIVWKYGIKSEMEAMMEKMVLMC